MAAPSGLAYYWKSGRSVVECNRHMLTSEHNYDVTFRVGKGEKPTRAHRYMLTSRSCVFDAMLCGPQAEKDDIKIPDVEADIFSDMLEYLYTDDVTVTPGNVTGLLHLAKKYAIGGLVTLCLTHLECWLSPENACLILEHAYRFDEKDLYDKACKVVLQHGDTCFATESFKNLCHSCFDNIMKSGDLIVQPEIAFEAATAWAEAECVRKGKEITPKNLRSILGETVYGIPFISMEKDYYVNNVVPRGILTDAEYVKIMSCLLCPEQDPSPFCGRKIPMYQPVQPSYNTFLPHNPHSQTGYSAPLYMQPSYSTFLPHNPHSQTGYSAPLYMQPSYSTFLPHNPHSQTGYPAPYTCSLVTAPLGPFSYHLPQNVQTGYHLTPNFQTSYPLPPNVQTGYHLTPNLQTSYPLPPNVQTSYPLPPNFQTSYPLP